jgi:F0F1-type ATP synthase assembly protein I
MAWVARLTTIALEMVLPGVLGYGIDRWWSTGYLFTISGFVLGFVVALIHLVRIAADDAPPAASRREDAAGGPRPHE